VAENTPIEEIRERLDDFVDALREAGADDIAEQVLKPVPEFTEMAAVRRAVQAIYEQLQHWRENPEELPETPAVQVTCNILEDACRNALRAGVIVAARPTIGAHAKRKFSVAVYAAIAVGIAFAIPVGLIASGVDITEPITKKATRSIELPQVEERATGIVTLLKSGSPELVTGVEFVVKGGCDGEERGGLTCIEAGERLWEPGRLPTFEAKLADQAYGILFAIYQSDVEGGLGRTQVLFAATNDTPPGTYRLQLEAAYLGYTPVPCGAVQQLLDECPEPMVGEDARHSGVEVAPLDVVVVLGSPESRLKGQALVQREQEAKRKLAEQRAEQIMNVLTDIEAAMKVTDEAVKRRKWQEVRERLSKLAVLFEPLDVLLSDPDSSGTLPPEVVEARERFGDHQDALKEFEDGVFDDTFKALNSSASGKVVDEDRAMAAIAKKKRISVELLEEIYTDRPEEIETRLKAMSKKHLADKRAEEDKLRERCGELQGGGWQLISTYLSARMNNNHVETRLGECLSPRLDDSCWHISCSYKKRVTVSELHPSQTREFRATFHVKDGSVLSHRAE